jgi:hypothetical protein
MQGPMNVKAITYISIVEGKCLIQKAQDELAVTLQMSVVSVHNLFHKELGISKVCRQKLVTSVDT